MKQRHQVDCYSNRFPISVMVFRVPTDFLYQLWFSEFPQISYISYGFPSSPRFPISVMVFRVPTDFLYQLWFSELKLIVVQLVKEMALVDLLQSCHAAHNRSLYCILRNNIMLSHCFPKWLICYVLKNTKSIDQLVMYIKYYPNCMILVQILKNQC